MLRWIPHFDMKHRSTTSGMTTCLLAVLVVLLNASPASTSHCAPDSLLIKTVNRAIEYCVRQDFADAQAIVDSLVAARPDQPEHWLYYASVINYRMVDEESFRGEEGFLAGLDKARELVDQRRDAGDSSLLLDYIEGCLDSWYAYHATRRQQYLRAMSDGLHGAKLLAKVEAECPDFSDVLLATGSYRFWRSVKLGWLPFVGDEREESIALVSQAMHNGLFHPAVAASNLAWMLMEMQRYEEAIELCEKWLQQYPGSRLFLFPYADALLAARRFHEADACYNTILAQLAQAKHNNHVNEFLCLEKQSQVALQLFGPQAALAVGERAISLDVSKENRDRFTERYERLQALLRECRQSQEQP